MIWSPKYETMPRPELEKLQLERLKTLVARVYEKVPFYRQAFQQKGITPDSIKSLADLSKLPFTSKQDFRDNYPLGLLAVPMDQVCRVHASSGTTGKPVVAPYTANDLRMWTEVMARTLTSAGVTKDDVMQNSYGYGLFTGGLGFHYGGERVGATVIPTSTGNTKRQLMLIQDIGTSVLTCTPSYTLILAEGAKEIGLDLRTTKLRLAVCGAEPWSEQMRADIEARLPIKAMDIYGLTEIVGPGVSVECEQRCGLHIFEDNFLPEVVNPQTGEPLPYGQRGELVFTTLTKEAQPVIRFRTRDITTLTAEPCKCGRTLVRMAKVTGRTDDMLKIRGVNVFPSQIESILLQVEGVEPQYLIIVDRERHLDDLEVWVEVSEDVFSDEMKRMEALKKKVKDELESTLGIGVKVRLVEPKSIARTEGKAKRVVDKREMGLK
ncbi:MAG: phenylacetate--CoA ligase [Dehalococcoidia bacterium]|nr:phenylacetate--CoA ligase [Dehalococcoidia bacterium]